MQLNKPKPNNTQSCGFLIVNQLEIRKESTFLEYLMGGMQMQLIVAVDFTSSNGIPTNPQSLHYNDPQKLNLYEQAIFAVGQILLQYDADQRVPIYGFGGKIYGNVSHCFPLNLNQKQPEVLGLQGMMAVYRQALNTCELSGPTLFGQILHEVVTRAEQLINNQQQQNYIVLLILTDGIIHDMQVATDLIVKGSNLPLSIIIVGMGNENFENMNILDADEVPLVDRTGKKMNRDIVQFVAFRDFGNDSVKLQSEVLQEIPNQVTSYYKQIKVFPNAQANLDPNFFGVDTNRSLTAQLSRQNSNELRIKNYQNNLGPQDLNAAQITIEVQNQAEIPHIPQEHTQQQDVLVIQKGWFQGNPNANQPQYIPQFQSTTNPQQYYYNPNQIQPGQMQNPLQQVINPQANSMASANYPQ